MILLCSLIIITSMRLITTDPGRVPSYLVINITITRLRIFQLNYPKRIIFQLERKVSLMKNTIIV